MSPSIDEIVLADDPAHWEALGFDVSDATVQIGTVRIRLAGGDAGHGMLGWSLRDIASTELDSIPTVRSQLPPHAEADEHPNAVVGIDHVVVMTPALDRSVQALQSAGLDLRRIREQPTSAGAPRQAFFRLGATILEVVQVPEAMIEPSGGPDGPARLWGLALLAADLDRAVERIGEHVSEIRPAVQPGRRIATLRRSAGLAVSVALMSRTDA